MAKKSRTPPPPRKVQAPKRRAAPRTSSEQKKFYLLLAAASAGLIGLAVALAFVASAGGGEVDAKDVVPAMKAAGCTYRAVNSTEAALHVSKLDAEVEYNTFPPTSGFHYTAPAIWNDYSDPVNPRLLVHNMEHGGVVIWYGTKISPTERRKLTDFYGESPNAIVVTPLPDVKLPGVKFPPHEPLGSRIALTAWTRDDKGHVAICPRFDEKAFATFRDAFRGKGPEPFPADQNRPGT